jgi:hypothetical protein
MISSIVSDLNANLFDNLSVFYIFIYMFALTLPEGDLKKIQTYRSISSGSYVIVCFLILVRLVALSVEKYADDDLRYFWFSPMSC